MGEKVVLKVETNDQGDRREDFSLRKRLAVSGLL